MNTLQWFSLIIMAWAGYLFLIFGLKKTLEATRHERQARGIARTRLFGNNRTPKLCGYHLGSLDRPGMKAVVDSTNCEVCNAPTHARS